MKAQSIYCNPIPLPDYPRGVQCYGDRKPANPLWKHPVPRDFRETADPSVIYEDGKWYLYPSAGMAYVSEDFCTWKHVRIEPYTCGYAPTVAKHRGRFLLTACGAPIFEADNPLGPFTEIGKVVMPDGSRIKPGWSDPMLFSDDDDRLYAYWGLGAPGIFAAELDPEKPNHLLTEPAKMFAFNPEHEWERFGEWNEDPTGCSLRQDLWNAELAGTITTDKGTLSIRHFVHAEDMAIVTELTAAGEEVLPSWTWHPYLAATARPGYPEDEETLKQFARKYGSHYEETLKPLTPNPAGRLKTHGDIHVWVQDLLVGGQYATAWGSQVIDGAQRAVISIANSYPETSAADEAMGIIEVLLDRSMAEWVEAHRQWWHAYYPQSYVTLPAKDLEALYWQTIYRYACNSRVGRFYIDTSGIWHQPSPWPYSTHDWNTQSAHWGVYTANRLDQGAEIVNRLHAAQDTLAANVLPEEWQEDSAFLHLSTVADMRGTRRADKRYYDLLGCLPWLLHNAWWQYRFSMDEAILRDTIYPLLKRSINLYFHTMWEDDEGRWHLQPTYSPETGVVDDANFDLALCKWGCHILLKSCKLLGIADPLIPRWQEAIEKLIDFPVDEHGYILGSTAPPPTQSPPPVAPDDDLSSLPREHRPARCGRAAA